MKNYMGSSVESYVCTTAYTIYAAKHYYNSSSAVIETRIADCCSGVRDCNKM